MEDDAKGLLDEVKEAVKADRKTSRKRSTSTSKKSNVKRTPKDIKPGNLHYSLADTLLKRLQQSSDVQLDIGNVPEPELEEDDEEPREILARTIARVSYHLPIVRRVLNAEGTATPKEETLSTLLVRFAMKMYVRNQDVIHSWLGAQMQNARTKSEMQKVAKGGTSNNGSKAVVETAGSLIDEYATRKEF